MYVCIVLYNIYIIYNIFKLTFFKIPCLINEYLYKIKKMANVLNVSLPDTEKELWDWMQEKITKRELSPSSVFRDALLERKKMD